MALVLKKLRVGFRGPQGEAVDVLDIPHYEIPDGAQVCLVGGSGSGKTTLLNVIAGIVLPSAGSVLHDSVDIAALPEHRRDQFRATSIGYVFQTFNLLQGLSARENIALAATLAGKSRGEAKKLAEALLDRVGLSHRIHARPGTMSVGEQQRTAIARAVVTKPRVVLADEPTANLDPENGAAVIDLLREVTQESKSQLVLVTHEPEVQARFDLVVPLKELAA